MGIGIQRNREQYSSRSKANQIMSSIESSLHRIVTPIEFWFDFASPYAYFATKDIERHLGRLGRPVHWRPFLLGVAFQHTGMGALNRTPMRGDYAKHDWARIARMSGLPFSLQSDHPFRSQAPARAFYWFLERKPEFASQFATAVFDRYYGQGLGISEIPDVLAVASDFTAATDDLGGWLESEAAKQVLRARTDEALAKGVFGSPFFLIGDEPFWGWDRLPMVTAWLENEQRQLDSGALAEPPAWTQ